jgi:ABC-type phosphate/phosphonate transport system substrate-binding protein
MAPFLLLPLVVAPARIVSAGPPAVQPTAAPTPKELTLGWVKYQALGCEDPGAELARYLTDKLKQSARPLSFRAETIPRYDLARINKRNYDLVYFTPYLYVKINNQRAANQRFRPIASYSFHGSRERFSTIVWKTSAGQTLDEVLNTLRNDRRKKLALVHPYSTSGFLWPSRLLGEGIDIPRGRITTVFVNEHDEVLRYLETYDEVVAAATFDTHLADYRRSHKSFPEHRAAALTPSLPLDVLAARNTVDDDELAAIREALLAMDRSNDTFKRCFSAVFDSWIEVDDSYYDLVRAFMKVIDAPPSLHLDGNCGLATRAWIETELAGWLTLSDGPADDRIECAPTRLYEDTLAQLRRNHPISGYVVEETKTPPKDDVRANFGSRSGIAPGMVARITRRRWLADDRSSAGDPEQVLARVTRVEGDNVYVRPVTEASWLTLKQDLDPSDRLIPSVEVIGYGSDNGGGEEQATLKLSVETANLTPNGGMDVSFDVEVLRGKTREKYGASPWGWLVEISHLDAKGVPVAHLAMIEPSEYKSHQTITLLGSSLSSQVTARLLGARRPTEETKGFGIWSAFSAWIVVLLGGLFGTALRWAGQATQPPSPAAAPASGNTTPVDRWGRRVRWVARHGVELLAGLGTALLLFVLFVTAAPAALKVLDSTAAITRLSVGAVGGVIGASGLGALALRLVGLKG